MSGPVKKLRTPLSKDTKAVLRVLRKHNEVIEADLHRIANVLVEIEFDLAAWIGNQNIHRASLGHKEPDEDGTTKEV